MHRAWMRVKRRLHERRLWSKARTLEDLGELTAQWLEGRIDHQPGYHGPVDVDEEPHLREALIALNRAGVVTNSSQAGFDCVGYGNSHWSQHAAVTGFARDEAVGWLRPALCDAGYAVVTDGGSDGVSGLGGVNVTFRDGSPCSADFGAVLDKRTIRVIYPGVSTAAINALDAAEQITIYDPQTGRNTLWAALDEAVRQPEQEKIVSTYDEELGACRAEYRAAKEAAKRWGDTPGPAAEVQAAEERLDRAAFALADKLDEAKSVAGTDDAPRDSVRPGLHNAPGSRYNHDPRVKADGSGGYTITTEDQTLQVRYDQQHGWGVHNEDGERLSGGHADPDSLIHTLIGAPHRRDTAGNIHGRQPQDNSGPAAAPDGTGSPHGGNTDTNEHAAAENDGVSGDTADADTSDQGQEAIMNGRDNLTPEQDRLYQGVLAIGRQNGMTCTEVLRLSGAANTDKAAVADAIAGTGAGDEFRQQDSQQSRGVDHAGRDNDTASEAPSMGEQAGRGDADDSADNTGSGSVGAHADAGETVNIPGDAVGSRVLFIADGGDRGSTSTAGTSTAGSGSGGGGQVNIGAVTSRGGQVHAGGDITGQKNTAVPQPRRQAESGSDSGDGW